MLPLLTRSVDECKHAFITYELRGFLTSNKCTIIVVKSWRMSSLKALRSCSLNSHVWWYSLKRSTLIASSVIKDFAMVSWGTTTFANHFKIAKVRYSSKGISDKVLRVHLISVWAVAVMSLGIFVLLSGITVAGLRSSSDWLGRIGNGSQCVRTLSRRGLHFVKDCTYFSVCLSLQWTVLCTSSCHAPRKKKCSYTKWRIL